MRREDGQAGIETLLVLPVLLLVALAGAQAATWVAADVLVDTAAGAGARALARGDPVEPAVRDELPRPFRRRVRAVVRNGVVHVTLVVPSFVPGAPGLRVAAEDGP